jgi:hypothetical protein
MTYFSINAAYEPAKVLAVVDASGAVVSTFTLTAGVAKTGFDRFISQLTQPVLA